MSGTAFDFKNNYSQNPLLLYGLSKKLNSTSEEVNIEELINTVWTRESFTRIQTDKQTYSPMPYISKYNISHKHKKENEWVELVGIEFYALSEEKRSFLLKTAGIFDFGEKIDIKKVYSASIY